MEANNSTNISTCAEKYDTTTYRALLYYRCVLAILSVIFILSMLTIIVLFKKYRFFTQRLILYLAISTLTYQMISVVDVSSVRAYSDQTALNYCIFIGFITQVVIWWPVMATAVIVFDIFVRVVLKKSTERLEIPYVFSIFFLSLLLNWIPFVNSGFGPSQYFCWIKDEELEKDCEDDFIPGIILRAALFYIPCYIIVAFMVIFLVITAVFLRRLRKAYSGKFDPQAVALKKKMEKEIRPILYYPIIFIVSIFVSFLLTIYNAVAVADGENETGYVVIAVLLSTVFRLQGVFITIVFTLDPETRNKLSVMEVKAAMMEFFQKDKNEEYPAKYNTRSDSVASNA